VVDRGHIARRDRFLSGRRNALTRTLSIGAISGIGMMSLRARGTVVRRKVRLSRASLNRNA
jgi:hypothetical protein